MNAPRNTARFHVVGQGDVVGPDVELPFPETQHSAMDATGMNSHAHVDVNARNFADQPGDIIYEAYTQWSHIQSIFSPDLISMDIGRDSQY